MSLTAEEQEIRCVQHWFQNWSQPQRAEFLNLLSEKFSPDTVDLGRSFQSLRISSSCPSVFECQLKQFSLWFDEWSLKGKENFSLKLLEIDRPFVELLHSKISLQNQKMANKGPIGIAEQLNYLIQWFMEYSEMQKEDFYAILLDAYSHKDMNGVSNSLNSLDLNNERPPSIFQCRMKLFREWHANWNEEERSEFLARLGRMDEKFMEKFNAELGCNNVD